MSRVGRREAAEVGGLGVSAVGVMGGVGAAVVLAAIGEPMLALLAVALGAVTFGLGRLVSRVAAVVIGVSR